jgi:hypothetical protein
MAHVVLALPTYIILEGSTITWCQNLTLRDTDSFPYPPATWTLKRSVIGVQKKPLIFSNPTAYRDEDLGNKRARYVAVLKESAQIRRRRYRAPDIRNPTDLDIDPFPPYKLSSLSHMTC